MIDADALHRDAVAALQAGDFATAGERFERAAEGLAATRPDDALHALESATRLALMRDDISTAATILERARSLRPDDIRVHRLAAEVADRLPDDAARITAWQRVAQSDLPGQRHHALLRLAALSRNAQEHAQSVTYFSALVDSLPETTPALSRAEVLLELAVSHTAINDVAAARAALDDADATIPRGTADKHETLRNRVAGQRAVLSLVEGDAEAALRQGEAVRERAVQLDDVMTYLGATALIAMVHEQANRLVDAYDTYVRARESLAGLLGDDGRRLVAPAIELFEARLGADFAPVWNEWVARRRAATPRRDA